MADIPPALARRFAEVQAYRDSLDLETDRGCAIAATAYIDAQLAEMLKAHLIDSKKLIKETFSKNGSLASFSARIGVSFLLGYVSETAHRELHLLRSIRNKFAHSENPLSFSEPAIAQQCGALSYSFHPKAREPRAHFCSSATAILAFIHVAHHEAQRPSSPTDYRPTEAQRESVRGWAMAMFGGRELR